MAKLAAGCSFDELVSAAAGHEPYPYQRRLAMVGLPELLHVPTGAGKTLAATLPWLYRRRFHPDPEVRTATPRRLVFVLPQRALVEQTRDAVEGWLKRAELDVGLHLLLGGSSTDDRRWKHDPVSDAIFIGTQDMVLSRLLLRGYGERLGPRPISFGLLHAGTQFVFDEVQLMGPGLTTSLQIEGLRRSLGMAEQCSSMWMSATADPSVLATIDYPKGPAISMELGGDDRAGRLARRLEATRLIKHLEIDNDPKRFSRALAEEALRQHVPGTRTLVVLNTVERAQNVYDALTKAKPDVDVLLLHSRFRPYERRKRTDCVREAEDAIVVATQVLEAGIDLTSSRLVTESAPWSSIVQRAGRCNREGEAENAVLAWVSPPASRYRSAPYNETDLTATEAALRSLEGQAVTSSDLARQQVIEQKPVYPVLRRRDLISLFDTTPDLADNDLDVGRWIRDADETNVYVAWRDEAPSTDSEARAVLPYRDELCPVPIGDIQNWYKTKKKDIWRLQQTTSSWAKVTDPTDLRPGVVYIVLAADGGYLPDRGWSLDSKQPVDSLERLGRHEDAEAPDGVPDDPSSVGSGEWVLLAQHLDDVGTDVSELLEEFGTLPGLTESQRKAAVLAGYYHDLGKAHPVFEQSIRKAAVEPPPGEGPWAKSPTNRRLMHKRRYFRHELVSALMLLDGAGHLLTDVSDPDLVVYLSAAHHGKVRMSVRSMPDEDAETVLGVGHNEDGPTARFALSSGDTVPAVQVSTDRVRMGSDDGHPAWTAMATGLRDRSDLGPFRLGFLEAAVRVSDQRVSRSYRKERA